MDLELLSSRTDVTTIGYGCGELDTMLRDEMVPIRRVCVDRVDTYKATLYKSCVSCVVGFPFGDPTLHEIETAIVSGANEIDFPIPVRSVYGATKIRPGCLQASIEFSSWLDRFELPLNNNIVYKFILHTDLFEKIYGSESVPTVRAYTYLIHKRFGGLVRAGRLYMKTSTGYGPGGATLEAIGALKKDGYLVKASGGIRSVEMARNLLDEGADLLGIGYSSYRSIVSSCTEK